MSSKDGYEHLVALFTDHLLHCKALELEEQDTSSSALQRIGSWGTGLDELKCGAESYTRQGLTCCTLTP